MFDAGTLTFQEFVMNEPLPLATIQNAVLEFLRDRDDGVVFGAQAVNAYVSEPRMTQDIDLLSTRAKELADELREHLSRLFHIAVRVREIGEGRGYRLFQIQKSGNRHLIEVRPVESLPPAQRVAGVLVMAPAEIDRQQSHLFLSPPGSAEIIYRQARHRDVAFAVPGT